MKILIGVDNSPESSDAVDIVVIGSEDKSVWQAHRWDGAHVAGA